MGFLWYSSFFPHTKDVHVSLVVDSKLAINVYLSEAGFLVLCVSLLVDR